MRAIQAIAATGAFAGFGRRDSPTGGARALTQNFGNLVPGVPDSPFHHQCASGSDYHPLPKDRRRAVGL